MRNAVRFARNDETAKYVLVTRPRVDLDHEKSQFSINPNRLIYLFNHLLFYWFICPAVYSLVDLPICPQGDGVVANFSASFWISSLSQSYNKKMLPNLTWR